MKTQGQMESRSLLLPYHLQFFAEDKTEEATGKKIEDTRKKGQVGKSQELTYAVSLIVIFVVIKVFVGGVGERFIHVFNWVYGSVIPDFLRANRGGVSHSDIQILFRDVFVEMFLITVPFFVLGYLAALFGTGLQFSFRVTADPLQPKLDKMSPINGFKRIFSLRSLFQLFLSIIKVVLILVVAYSSIQNHLTDLFVMYQLDLSQGVALVGDIVISTGLRIAFVYLGVGVADLLFQKWKFKNDIKMTKQEVKDEYKNSEGDPQIKGKQKQKMREVSQRRMMKSVPDADVVITNPTHIAVAIKYDEKERNAPWVVAKGEEVIARRIREAAQEANVPIVENKPLARAMYETVEIGEMIPPELYQAVAEILAGVLAR